MPSLLIQNGVSGDGSDEASRLALRSARRAAAQSIVDGDAFGFTTPLRDERQLMCSAECLRLVRDTCPLKEK